MSIDQTTGEHRRFQLNVVLYVVVVLALIACVVGGVFALRRDDIVELPLVGMTGASDDELELQEEYADVLAAARREAQAFVNIDYRDMDASLAAVLEGATGEFREQFDKADGSLRRILRDSRSIMVGEVLTAGVVNIDQDSARVFVGTRSTVRNTATRNQPQGREFRLQVDLVEVDGEWLTSNITFLDGGLLSPPATEGGE